MSVSSVVSRNNYTGNGSVNEYDYTFRIFDEDDLTVTVRNTSDVETTLTKTTDYTVSGVGVGAGGSITLVSSGQAWLTGGNLTTGYVITIRRVLDLTQATDIRNQGDFYPEAHEDQFDRGAMIDQQQQDEIDRSIKLPETIDPADFDAAMPASIVGQANVTIMTNATGDGFEEGPTSSEISNAQTYAESAESWATKTDGVVASAEYSSKAYALGGTGITDTAGKGAAKEWAVKTGSTVDGTDYSAKKHATDAASSAAAAAASAALVTAAMPFRDVSYKVFADSPVTVTASDAGVVYAIDCTSGAVTINLPSIAAVTSTPKAFMFKKTDATVNKVTITRDGTDTIDGSSTYLLESEGQAVILVADTGASPDDWTSLPHTSGQGVGGGGSIVWTEQANSPFGSIQNNVFVYGFDDSDQQQYLYTFIKVPNTYVPGGQIRLRSLWYTSVTSGTVLFTTVATLIRVGTDAASSTTNQRTSTNSATTVNGSANIVTAVACDLTSSTGQINSVSVSAGDLILIMITRDTTTDTAASTAYLYAHGSEVTYV